MIKGKCYEVGLMQFEGRGGEIKVFIIGNKVDGVQQLLWSDLI